MPEILAEAGDDALVVHSAESGVGPSCAAARRLSIARQNSRAGDQRAGQSPDGGPVSMPGLGLRATLGAPCACRADGVRAASPPAVSGAMC